MDSFGLGYELMTGFGEHSKARFASIKTDRFLIACSGASLGPTWPLRDTRDAGEV
jgi:hypothetical protein